MKKEIIILVGTRPEAIKMAPLIYELNKSETLQPFLLSTGQHRELLDQSLKIFDLKADCDLQLMQPNQLLVELTSRTMLSIYDILTKRNPSAILIQGDTTSVLSAAIAATYANIPAGHVEAGLRTYDIKSPFPEEMNRRLVTPLCRWLFAPTLETKNNLIKENISKDSIYVTGNTVIDSLFWICNKIKQSNMSDNVYYNKIGLPNNFALDNTKHKLVLITGHRRENFGQGMNNICKAITKLASSDPNIIFIYPVHLNPNVQIPVNEMLGGLSNVFLVPPVDYESFAFLMMKSSVIISDSGGVQEEAPSLGKPVLVTRDKTERPEGVNAGSCILVGTNIEKIIKETNKLLYNLDEYKKHSSIKNPYGDGFASCKIRQILERDL
jgi:UDP-N-acetylglucosamine 2-epimerase (non-hydrolysing)